MIDHLLEGNVVQVDAPQVARGPHRLVVIVAQWVAVVEVAVERQSVHGADVPAVAQRVLSCNKGQQETRAGKTRPSARKINHL